jgi:hypothetical protein
MANLPKRLGYARIDRVSVIIQGAWGMLPIVVVPGHRNPYGSSLYRYWTATGAMQTSNPSAS